LPYGASFAHSAKYTLNLFHVLAKTITFCTSKGGTGKSTLVRNLAAYWISSGSMVTVIDADPQASIWNRHDPDGPLRDLKIFFHPEEKIEILEKDAQKSADYILIDTGGFRNRTTAQALLCSSYAIIPLKPSADDVTAALETYQLIQALNQTPEKTKCPIRPCFILTMTQRGTILAKHVRAELEQQGFPLLKAELPLRVAYPESAIHGLSPCITEPTSAAAKNISYIAQELQETLWR
jgi:chromosome partitioning protein